MSEHIPKDVHVLADSGYQELQKQHQKTILPYKRWRKRHLVPKQKAHNHALASKRVSVEHVFVQLKNSKFWAQSIEISGGKLHLMFNIIAGIYNLRFS